MAEFSSLVVHAPEIKISLAEQLKECMQDKEADMLFEKQARLGQQGVQQASNIPAGKPKEVEAQQATSKELQQAEVSAA